MKRYVKSSAIAPYADIEKKQLTPEQREMKKAGQRNNQELAWDMLHSLSENKRAQLDKFLSRNEALTSTYGCSFGNLRIYKEGFYLTLDGTRSQFSVWFYDNDGNLIEDRKPNENKLSFLYEQDLRFNGVDWEEVVGDISTITSATDPETGWPDSNWWLSNERRKDEASVNQYVADIEEEVLDDMGLYITVYRNDLQVLSDDDAVLAEMDKNRYVDNELQMAASCRSPKEFQGKYRMWIEHLIESEGLDDNYLNWDANHR